MQQRHLADRLGGEMSLLFAVIWKLLAVPEARETYISLSRAAVKFLPVKHRAGLIKELDRINHIESPSKA